MEKCKPLAEYSRFVDKVRIMLKETKDLGSAIGKAIDELTDDSLIKPFLMANKAEVTRMCITEFNEEKFRNQTFEEGRIEGIAVGIEKGIEKGKKEGILEALIGLVKRGLITIGQAASQADMSVSEFEALTGLKA